MTKMTSNRPYLIRAIYDWLVDNGFTPHLLVDATNEEVIVPREFVENGRIVLNVAPSAVRDIYLGNDMISFSARFHGRPMELFIPPRYVMGIYARENEVGMLFTDESAAEAEEEHAPEERGDEQPRPPKGRPNLKVIK